VAHIVDTNAGVATATTVKALAKYNGAIAED
jgi:hypothetical protein